MIPHAWASRIIQLCAILCAWVRERRVGYCRDLLSAVLMWAHCSHFCRHWLKHLALHGVLAHCLLVVLWSLVLEFPIFGSWRRHGVRHRHIPDQGACLGSASYKRPLSVSVTTLFKIPISLRGRCSPMRPRTLISRDALRPASSLSMEASTPRVVRSSPCTTNDSFHFG